MKKFEKKRISLNHSNAEKNTSVLQEMPVHYLFALEDIFPRSVRLKILVLFDFLVGLFFVTSVFMFLATATSFGQVAFSNLNVPFLETFFENHLSTFFGLFLLSFAVWSVVYATELFYRSLYYHNREPSSEGKHNAHTLVSEVAAYFHKNTDGDILKAFLLSQAGQETLSRSGIFSNIHEFLEQRHDMRPVSVSELFENDVRTRVDLGVYLYEKYDEFANFLFQHEVTKERFEGALSWVVQDDVRRKFKARWWSKARLLKLPAIGKEWAYGGAYQLARFSHDVNASLDGAETSDFQNRRKHYVEDIEALLSKTVEANALVVGDDGGGKKALLEDIARRISSNIAPKEIAGFRLVSLHTELLVSGVNSKNEFERTFLSIVRDAAKAGNVILVFEDLPSFLKSAERVGSDVLRLMDQYIANTELKMVALSNQENYHQTLETNSLVANRFGVVTVTEPGVSHVVKILQDFVPTVEHQYGVFLTYGALSQIAQIAKYYIVEGVMPDKALDLLFEIAPKAAQQNTQLIDATYVEKYASDKIHIPMGQINDREQKKLENLENALHELVVGQNHAIDALSDTLRRARTGLRDVEKPIGSFLFLGPTGVGKTQTAKAIAEVFFENREAMARIDMSEYQSADALERLIGSFESGQVGTLTTMVKTNPYGVLLLDEFEKSDRRVHDLFLQIFDEGFFSDMNGRRVNARNLVFIATSNAGSDLIWKAAKEGRDMTSMKKTLTNHLIEQGIYRPEFLNRFDDVVVFHPLSKKQLKSIAELMLESTKKRIYDKGYELVITDALLDYVVETGYDPVFGARPMERAIQDTVENVISKKIIHGALQKGDEVVLQKDDLKNPA